MEVSKILKEQDPEDPFKSTISYVYHPVFCLVVYLSITYGIPSLHQNDCQAEKRELEQVR